MQTQTVTVPAGDLVLRVDGPDSGHAVMFLPASSDAVDSFDHIAERLVTSDLRTVVIEPSVLELGDADLLAVLDALKLAWVNLVGRGEGADLAWSLAARTFGRVSSLVVIDRGHPAVREEACPAVELRTTMVVADPAAQPDASASSRFVYGDYRVITLDAADPEAASAALATEIVMRTSAW